MTPQEAMSILEHISAAYARFEITEKRVSVWLEHLEKMPYKKVLARLNHHIAEKAFPPTISEISAFDAPKNEFLNQHEQWLREGAERIERDKLSGGPRR